MNAKRLRECHFRQKRRQIDAIICDQLANRQTSMQGESAEEVGSTLNARMQELFSRRSPFASPFGPRGQERGQEGGDRRHGRRQVEEDEISEMSHTLTY